MSWIPLGPVWDSYLSFDAGNSGETTDEDDNEALSPYRCITVPFKFIGNMQHPSRVALLSWLICDDMQQLHMIVQRPDLARAESFKSQGGILRQKALHCLSLNLCQWVQEGVEEDETS